jgi:foldase protein PrsA
MKRIILAVIAAALCLASAGAWAGGPAPAAPGGGTATETPRVSVIGEVKPRPELETLQGVRAWVINGTEIPMTKIEELGALYHGPYILQDLVAELLLQQAAAAKNITLTEAEVQQTIADLREQLGVRSDAAFESFLRAQNATPQWFHDKARAYALMKKVLADQVFVTDVEVEAYYQHNPQMSRRGAVVAFRMMGFQNKAAADAALAEVQKGKGFQAVAKATAATAQDRAVAGELQYYEQGQQNMPPEFATALLAAPLNQVTGPVQVGGWFYLIKIEQKIDAHQFTLDQIREVLRQQLSQQKLEQVKWPEWVQAQLKAATIQVLKAQQETGSAPSKP